MSSVLLYKTWAVQKEELRIDEQDTTHVYVVRIISLDISLQKVNIIQVLGYWWTLLILGLGWIFKALKRTTVKTTVKILIPIVTLTTRHR